MRVAPKTILGQLIAGSVIVQLLVFGTFLAYSVRREFRQTQVRDRHRMQQQAGTIAGVVGEPLVNGDAAMLDTIMRSLPVSTTIRGARITDASGKTLRVSSNALSPELSARERGLLTELIDKPRYHREVDAEGVDEAIQPVVRNGTVLGVVWITPNGEVTRRYPDAFLQDVLTYGAFALLGNLLLVWALSATMARPLRQLRKATLQVQHNPNDLSQFPLPILAQNEAGELTGSFNAMVSEIARQRRSTLETLNLLDAMLTSAPIGFAFYDREHRYVRLNEHMARLNGLPVHAHLGKRYRDLVIHQGAQPLADEMEDLLARVFRTGEEVADYELSGTPPGELQPRVWRTSYFPVSVAGGEVRWVGVIATEITERRHAEEAMRRSEKLAAAGRLAASIAHEINNPLESVTNLLYLLEHHAELDSVAASYVATAQQELTRMAEITQQTLRFYRQSSRPTDVHIGDVLRSVLLLHSARLHAPAIKVELRLQEGAILFGFSGELRQVLANLIGNAIDAMPKGGRLLLRVRSASRLGRRGVRVTAADTGVGMTDAVRRRIFEPFFTTKEATGTGLGLWVSAEIITKHGGVMQVRSRVAGAAGTPSGTVFSMFLPYDGVPRGPVRVTSAAQVLADHAV